MCGLAKEKRLNTLALCSESTGRENFAVVSVGTSGLVTEKAKVCSLAETPCMELPGDISVFAINYWTCKLFSPRESMGDKLGFLHIYIYINGKLLDSQDIPNIDSQRGFVTVLVEASKLTSSVYVVEEG